MSFCRVFFLLTETVPYHFVEAVLALRGSDIALRVFLVFFYKVFIVFLWSFVGFYRVFLVFVEIL